MTECGLQGVLAVPGYEVIILFLILGLLLSAGWEGLKAVVAVALRLGMSETSQNNWHQLAHPGSKDCDGRD
jgi:hypothetical protein